MKGGRKKESKIVKKSNRQEQRKEMKRKKENEQKHFGYIRITPMLKTQTGVGTKFKN